VSGLPSNVIVATGSFSDFFQALLEEFRNGIFLFASPWDIFISCLDVAVTTFAIYYILKLLSETRAWQLLKGMLWLIVFTVIAGWLGLKTINYALVNSISILVVGLVVIFQPELRRALESVGQNSINLFAPRDDNGSANQKNHNMIESIAVACEIMAEEKTGALIIIERQTALGDLVESGTAVILDAELTSTALRQIFYKNSPTHDGAVIIRGGRIYAARVHVPLSDSYQVKKEMGTRHRAAIGASDIGDTIAIVVSEEKGTISLAVRGRLYTLDHADALRTVLRRLLSPGESLEDHYLPRHLRKLLRLDKTKSVEEERKREEEVDNSNAAETIKSIEDEGGIGKAGLSDMEVTTNPKRSKALILVIALVSSLALWLYVRVTTNPIRSRTFDVPLVATGVEQLEIRDLSYVNPVSQVRVTIRGREETLTKIDSQQVQATVDFSSIEQPDVYELEVHVNVQDVSVLSYEVSLRNPDTVSVSVYQAEPVNQQAD
jgi:diadenylate cyclase